MEPPRFNPPTTTCPPLIPFCRSELQRAIIKPTPTALPLWAVESKQLDGKFMLARITVADQQLGPRVKILLRALDAFLERRRRGLIQDADAGTRPDRRIHPEQARVFVLPAGADDPKLSRRQWIVADAVLAVQFGR